jgi:hypothetical protein
MFIFSIKKPLMKKNKIETGAIIKILLKYNFGFVLASIVLT